MKMTYDQETDALYITLIEGSHECRTLKLNEAIALNIGPREQLIGIEIQDAKSVIGAGQIPNLVVNNISVDVDKE